MRWRAERERLAPQARNDALLQHLADCLSGSSRCKLTFLGKPLCKRAFKYVTRINPSRFVRLARQGVKSWMKSYRKASRTRYDEMYAAISSKLELLKDSSPFVRRGGLSMGDEKETMETLETSETTIQVPFHEKIYLYRMIVLDYEDSAKNPKRTPTFIRKPTYSTFRSERTK